MNILFLSFFVFIFGLIIGSFLNALIWRLHTGESMLERSKCPKCGQMIAWYDNIPVLSYLFLLGKCRHCKTRISFQYPIVELVTALLFLLSFNIIAQGVQFFDYKLLLFLFRDFFLISLMIVVFIYDLRWYLILDVVTLPAIVVLFVLNLALGISWHNMLLSGIIGGGFFLLQFIISRGKWIGGGDIRLGFLMGIALGWPQIVTALMLAYISGAFVGTGLMLFGKKKWSSQLPFGVFLSVATVVSLFWGNLLVAWYFGVIGIY